VRHPTVKMLDRSRCLFPRTCKSFSRHKSP